MAEQKYKLVFYGRIEKDRDLDTVKKRLCALLNVTESRADELFSGKAVELKRDIDRETALRYQRAVEDTGALCAIERMPAKVELTKPAAGPSAPPPPPAAPSSATQNVYAAPKASLISEMDYSGDLGLREPRRVNAGNAWAWIRDGFELFKRNPGIWIVNILIWIIILSVISVIPLVSVAAYIVSPILSAGFMAGCLAQDRGEDLTVGHLFAGFQQYTGRLAGVGGLSLLAILAIGLVVGLLMVIIGGGFAIFSQFGATTEPSADGFGALLLGPAFIMILLVGMGLTIPVLMAFWFAPVLVMLHDIGAIESIVLSLKGCLINWLPFLVYGLIVMLLSIVAMIPVFLGFLILGPVLMASIYTSHKDIFVDNSSA